MKENPDRTNRGMLSALIAKKSYVIDAGIRGGFNVEAALREVDRQIRQYMDHVPITKSE